MDVVGNKIPKDLIPGPQIRCGKCGVVIQSKGRYDYDRCKCGAIYVYGPEFFGDRELAFDQNGDPWFQRCAEPFCGAWIRTSEAGLCPAHLDEFRESQSQKQDKRKKA
jgi:hypothetical protein